jgi:hypothetical protein
VCLYHWSGCAPVPLAGLYLYLRIGFSVCTTGWVVYSVPVVLTKPGPVGMSSHCPPPSPLPPPPPPHYLLSEKETVPVVQWGPQVTTDYIHWIQHSLSLHTYTHSFIVNSAVKQITLYFYFTFFRASTRMPTIYC